MTTTEPLTAKARTTRAALVRSAYELFVERGYGAVSVRDLARRTHMTSGAIYGHFRNKADLLVAAIAEHIESDLYPGPGGSGRGIRWHLQRQWRDYRSRAGLRALLVEAAAAARVDPEVERQMHDLQAARLAEWRVVYREIQEREGLDPDVDMDAVLVMLWATELGLGLLEAWDVELPKPATWGRLVDRVLGALERDRDRRD
jgi:TetR/AcrR family acrAB operon transcriptional repressor